VVLAFHEEPRVSSPKKLVLPVKSMPSFNACVKNSEKFLCVCRGYLMQMYTPPRKEEKYKAYY
jgi:hypothetical protein